MVESLELSYLKQEHKVSYRCSLPSPLQKRSKDYKGLGCSASFELMSFLRLRQEAQNFYAILCNSWINGDGNEHQ